jgi:hypothetical protein
MLKTETKRIVDTSTGELLAEEISSYDVRYENEPPYVKTYVSDIMRIQGLTGYTNNVMMEIIRTMGYNNIFAAFAPIKRVMCANLGVGMDTINKSIDNLSKAGILIRKDRGVYLVDPNLFAKGKWADIKKLRLTIEYDTSTGKKTLSSNLDETKILE